MTRHPSVALLLVAALALVSMPAGRAWSAETLSCESPVEAVCSVPPGAVAKPHPAELRARVLDRAWASLGRTGPTDPDSLNPDPAQFRVWLVAVEKSVLTELGDRFGTEKLAQLSRTLRAAYTRILESDPRLATHREGLKQSLARSSISGIADYLAFAKRYAPPGDDIESDLLTACGGDGLGTNLLNTPFEGEVPGTDAKTGRKITVPAIAGIRITLCPGKLLEFLHNPDAEWQLTRSLAHELAHGFDLFGSFRGYDLQAKKQVSANFEPLYRPLAACLKANYSAELLAPPVTDPKDPVGALLSGADAREDARKRLTQLLKRKPEPVDFYLNEAIADAWANRISAALFAASPADSSRLEASVSHLCDSVGDLGTGTHPDGRFRIEALFAEPTVRKALGCTRAAAKPACGI